MSRIVGDTSFYRCLFYSQNVYHGYAVSCLDLFDNPTFLLPYPVLYVLINTEFKRKACMSNVLVFRESYDVELTGYDIYVDQTIDEYFNSYNVISLSDLAVRKELEKGNIDFLLTTRANLYTDIFNKEKIFDESYFSN